MADPNNSKPSLYATLVAVVATTVISIMTLHGTYSYITTKNLIIDSIKQDSKQSIASLQQNIANLIEAYAINEYEQLILTELEEREILAIIVEDDNMAKIMGSSTYVSGKVRTPDGTIIDYDPESHEQNQQLENAYYSNEEIISNAIGEKLGKIKIYASDTYLNTALHNIITDTTVDTIFIISLLLFFLFVTIRYFFIKPLSDIGKVITNSHADGIPIDDIPQTETRELSALTDSMNKMIASIRDSRQQLQEQHEILRTEKNRFQHVLDGAELGYWDWNYKTGEHIVNDRGLAMLGLTANDVNNNVSDWENLIHPDDKDLMRNLIQTHLQSGTGYTAEFRMKHRDGHWLWIEGSGAVVEYDPTTHEPLRLCGTHQDITAKKLAEEKLKLSSRVFSSTHEGIIITDHNGTIVDVNPAFTEITGYSRDDAVGQNPSLLNSGKQRPEFYEQMWQKLIHHDYWQGELWNRTKQGDLYAELLTVSSLKNEADQVQYYVGIFSDITEHKKQQEQLNLLAHYDVLTGLPNRVLFADRFKQAIAHSKRTQQSLAICFIDLDNFKPINDKHGHETGDQLLVEVSGRIQNIIREEDTVSRLGGDEFTLLLNDVSSTPECEKTLQRIIDSLAQPYNIDDYSHKITASIGVTLYPADDEDIDTLLRHADQAMYQAKLAGKNRYHFFDSEQDLILSQKKLRIEEIRHALNEQELTLYYQPKINMASGHVYGAEALLRWLHPEKGLIPPLDFLPLLEGTALECEVGEWVINQALNHLDIWLKQGLSLQVSVNISYHHLQQEDFITKLDAALAKYPDVNSNQLQLEILESSILSDLQHIRTTMKACQQALGVSFALDDFGTGYSSLTHLRSLSANTIKIDQSFVRDLLDDPNDYVIVNSVILLSESFNREIIAEGVETIEHGLMLILMGCDKAQGYGIAKPMPAEHLPEWIVQYQPYQQWIDCANNPLSTGQNRSKQLHLTTQHWFNQFSKCIQSEPEKTKHWPISNTHKCHYGVWLQRAHKENLFPAAKLAELTDIHEQMHIIANQLYTLYQDGETDKARNKLAELQDIQSQIQVLLEINKSSQKASLLGPVDLSENS